MQQEPLDLESLVVSHEGDHAEALVLVLGLIDGRADQRRDGHRFRGVGLVRRPAVLHPVGDDVRLQGRLAGIAQRADPPAVAEVVRELDDLRHAAEVLGQADRSPEGLPRQVVDGHLAVVEHRVGNVLEVLVDELLDDREILPHRGRAHLLVVAHDHHPARHVERDQRHDVALARLVRDHHVEARGRLEGFHRLRQGHDPHRDRRAALGHLLAGLDDEARNALPHPLADPAHHVEPAHQGLLLLRSGPPHLRSPRAALDQLGGHLPQLGADPIDLRLQRGQGGLPSLLQLVVKLPPEPGRLGVAGRGGLVVRRPPLMDCQRPGRRRRVQRIEKVPSSRGGLPLAIELDQPLVGLAVVRRRLPLGRAEQLRQHWRGGPLLRERQRRLHGLELGGDLAEPGHLLAHFEGLRQTDGDDLPEPLQLCFGAAAARLRGEELTPLESVLLQLLLDPFPLLGVPREAPANLLGEVRRALGRLFRDLRPGRSGLRDHLAVPPSLEISLHDPEHDLPAQRLEVDGGLRLAGGDPALGDEPLPRAMGQEGELPQALPFLRVGEDLVDDLELLLQRDALRKLRSVLEDALLRAGCLLGELVDHLQQPVPLGPLGSAFLAGDHRGDLPGLLPI